MKTTHPLNPVGLTLLVAALTVAASTLAVFGLVQAGVFFYAGGGWLARLANLARAYLGTSLLFFIPVFILCLRYLVLLKVHLASFFRAQSEAAISSEKHGRDAVSGRKQSLDAGGAEERIRHCENGLDLFITLLFAIGVTYTALGLSEGLVRALDLSRGEAVQIGAWGILRRLVDQGILIALWTTIFGAVSGYAMRLAKFAVAGKDLLRFEQALDAAARHEFFAAIEAVRGDIRRLGRRGPDKENGDVLAA